MTVVAYPTKLVVHWKRHKFDVYIGRPSIWGNPYKWLVQEACYTPARFQVRDREEALMRYETWVRGNIALMGQLHHLRGKVLGCWCAPLRCHGDVLVRLIEEIGTS